VATKTPDTEAAPPPPKSKKMLLLGLVALIVLALVGGGWLYLSKRHAAALDDEDEDEVATAVAEPSGPPAYLPLDNMVVNLADPGGERVAQVGVTLELTSALSAERVKAYLPSIRSDILMLISQRTADDMLRREGKEQLAADIQTAASRHFVKQAPAGKNGKNGKKKEKAKGSDDENPIRGVLFSSFIVQ
jgi:flagellar FliL protein